MSVDIIRSFIARLAADVHQCDEFDVDRVADEASTTDPGCRRYIQSNVDVVPHLICEYMGHCI